MMISYQSRMIAISCFLTHLLKDILKGTQMTQIEQIQKDNSLLIFNGSKTFMACYKARILSLNNYILNYRNSNQQIMGQTCQGIEQQENQPETVKIKNINTFSTAEPLEESSVNVYITESRLLQSRAKNVKKMNSSLNESVRMRLSQLPDISRFKTSTLQEGKKVYLNSLKANYYGQLANNRPVGYGALEFDNGDYLEGDFVNGHCEGHGRYIKSNGSYYEGDLKNNVADGFGKYFDKSGYKYEGQWKNNMANGRGQAVYEDESKYNGQFINNKRHGHGVLMQKKCIFEGNFVNNKLEGNATMQNENGQRYEGQWKNNEKHGTGVYTWPNGNKYEGQYKNGKRQGFGKMVYANGQIYEGNWINGVKEGDGLYKSTKATIKGIWKKGDLIEERK